jgi:putative acetyltransferase
MQIRVEQPWDAKPIRAVNLDAFPTRDEADLVDRLRGQASPIVSLVADDRGIVRGHIMFSPVTVSERPDLRIMGLAPMAVMHSYQRRGIGSALVRAGLDACRAMRIEAVVVLGHPEYYPRFGFRPASRFGLSCEYDVPDEAFMAIELEHAALEGQPGRVHYHSAFATL